MADTRRDVRLTQFSHGAGCACKLAPADLARVMDLLGPTQYPGDVLVSPDTGDDAAVVRIAGGRALVQTVDFFTPIVDDPFDWGRIAAANALSDVYAMGGTPLTALNLVAWPVQELPLELLARVLDGGREIVAEAGAAIVGGHSIHDPEPKYGLAVTGLVDPERVVRNSTMRPGDCLVLTKPLGVGIVSTAVKRGEATDDQLAAAVEVMTTLNARACSAMVEVGVSGATDVTGFGLLGHLHISLRESGASARIDGPAVPFLAGVRDLAAAGVVPGGTRSNHAFVDPHVDWGPLRPEEQLMLADAQTSGGLLMAVAPDRAAALAEALARRGVVAGEIGAVSDGPAGRIRVEGGLRD
jgi:selenide,water dikinase